MVVQLAKEFIAFYGLVPCSQEFATGSCAEPIEYNPNSTSILILSPFYA
jgi:hypothetical protein